MGSWFSKRQPTQPTPTRKTDRAGTGAVRAGSYNQQPSRRVEYKANGGGEGGGHIVVDAQEASVDPPAPSQLDQREEPRHQVSEELPQAREVPDGPPQVEEVVEKPPPVRPPRRSFEYLPNGYSKFEVTATGVPAADQITATAKEWFDSDVLSHRKKVDSCLRDFKASLNEPPDATLLACVATIKGKMFQPWDHIPEDTFHFTTQRVTVLGEDVEVPCQFEINKDVSDEIKRVRDLVNVLLNTCKEYLENVGAMKQMIKELKKELLLHSRRTKDTTKIEGELDDADTDVDRFASEILDLLETFNSLIETYGKRQQTAYLNLLDD